VIKTKGKIIPLAVGEGFAKIDGTKISVLTDLALQVSEIDEKAAEEARKRAKEALADKERLSAEEYAFTAASLEKALAQLRIKRKHSHLKSAETSP
jgi:F-type H+-transporting ATPase subunit epsilon